MANSVQRLYEACRAAFVPGGGPASPQSFQRVHSSLDAIEPLDVGLEEDFFSKQDRGVGFFGMLNGHTRWRCKILACHRAPPIAYLCIYECDDFSVGIFCLPTSAVIPLHNHPGMTVLSKVLYGSMHVKAYDWVDPFSKGVAETERSQPRLAKLVVDRVISGPCESTILYPTSGGNIHTFRAVKSCAVLDVLAPPYSAVDERHCTYYREIPYTGSLGNVFRDEATTAHEELTWLEETRPPDNFVVKSFPYSGQSVSLK